MSIVGTAFVRVKLLSDSLKDDLKKSVEDSLTSELRNVSTQVGESIGQSLTGALKEQVDKALKDINDLKATINADLDDGKAKQDLRDLTEDQTVEIDADVTTAPSSAKLSWLTRLRTVKIKPVLDTKAFAAVEMALARVSGVNVFMKLSDSLKTMVLNLDTASFKIAGFTSLILGAAAAGGALVGWIGIALAQIGSLVALALPLPGLFAGALVPAAALMAILKDKTAGESLQDIREQLTELGSLMASSFWAQAMDPLREMATSVLPVLHRQLIPLSTELGNVGAAIFNAVSSGEGLSRLEASLADITEGTRRAVPGWGQLTDAVLRLTEAGTKYLPSLSDWFVANTAAFDEWIAHITASGQFDQWISNALDVSRALGSSLGSLGGIIGGIDKAAQAAGSTGIFGMAEGLRSLSLAINSVAGQQGLQTFFEASSNAMSKLGPGMDALGAGITSLLPQLDSLMSTAAAGYGNIAALLGNLLGNPAFQAGLQSLASGFEAFTGALANAASGPLGSALGDILSLVGQFVGTYGPLIVNALSGLSPVISELAGAFSNLLSIFGGVASVLVAVLTPAMHVLGPILGALTPWVLGAVAAFKTFTTVKTIIDGVTTAFNIMKLAFATNPFGLILLAITALIAVFVHLWNTNEGFRNAIITAWEAIKSFFAGIGDWFTGTFLPAITGVWDSIVNGVSTAFSSVGSFFSGLWNGIITGVSTAVSTIASVWGTIVDFFSHIFAAIGSVFAGIGTIIITPFQVAWETVKTVVATAILILQALFTGNFSAIGEIIQAAWDRIVLTFQTAIETVVGVTSGWVTSAIEIFNNVRDTITETVSSLWSNVTSAFTAGVEAVVSFVSALPGRILAAVASLVSSLTSWASSTWASVQSAFSAGLSAVVGVVSQLPGQVSSAVSGAATWLYNAGTQVMQGFINGITSMISNVTSAISNAVGGAVAWAEKLLGISSPSKVFIGIGKNTGEGFAMGIRAMTGEVSTAVSDMLDIGAAQRGTVGLGSGGSSGLRGGGPVTIEFNPTYEAPRSVRADVEDLLYAVKTGWR